MGWGTSSLLLSPFLVVWIAQESNELSFWLQRLICSYACMSRVASAGLPSLNLQAHQGRAILLCSAGLSPAVSLASPDDTCLRTGRVHQIRHAPRPHCIRDGRLKGNGMCMRSCYVCIDLALYHALCSIMSVRGLRRCTLLTVDVCLMMICVCIHVACHRLVRGSVEPVILSPCIAPFFPH